MDASGIRISCLWNRNFTGIRFSLHKHPIPVASEAFYKALFIKGIQKGVFCISVAFPSCIFFFFLQSAVIKAAASENALCIHLLKRLRVVAGRPHLQPTASG